MITNQVNLCIQILEFAKLYIHILIIDNPGLSQRG